MRDRSSVAVGCQRTSIHLGAEHLLDSSAQLFMGQDLTPAGLV
jgi:hypothetical protein